MLKSLLVEGFKCHKKTLVKFSTGLNLLVGRTQSGKSSFMDGFRLLAENRPLGGRFVHGGTSGRVRIAASFYDLTPSVFVKKVIRRKAVVANKTVYRVGRKSYRAVGQSIPPEVKTALNLSPANIQYQEEDSFLITSKGGEFSRIVSSHIGINEIEVALSKIKQALVLNKCRSEGLTAEVKIGKRELKEFRKLPLVGRRLFKLREIEQAGEKLEVERGKIEEAVAEIREVGAELRGKGKLLATINKTKVKVEQRAGELMKIDGEVLKFEREASAINAFINISGEVDRVKEAAKGAKQAYFKEMGKQKLCPFCFGQIDMRRVRHGA